MYDEHATADTQLTSGNLWQRIARMLTAIVVAIAFMLLCVAAAPRDSARSLSAGFHAIPAAAGFWVAGAPPAWVAGGRYDCADMCPSGGDAEWATVAAAPLDVGFSIQDCTVSERDGSAAITVTRDVASALTVAVDYATSDGTAVAGTDYVSASGTLTFAPGVTEQAFTVTVLDDQLPEPSETVSLTLSRPSSGTLGLFRSATLTILDDDARSHIYLPLVSDSSSAIHIPEGMYQFIEFWRHSVLGEGCSPLAIDFPTYFFDSHSGELFIDARAYPTTTMALGDDDYGYFGSGASLGGVGQGAYSGLFIIHAYPFSKEGITLRRVDETGAVTLEREGTVMVLAADEAWTSDEEIKTWTDLGVECVVTTTHRISNYGFEDREKIVFADAGPPPKRPVYSWPGEIKHQP